MPLITITDNFGSKGNEIGQSVAQDLGVGLFDDKRLQDIVAEIGMSARAEYRFDQQSPGFWERLRGREHDGDGRQAHEQCSCPCRSHG